MASDDFNRADENPLASPWAQVGSFAQLDLVSNAIRNNNGSNADTFSRNTGSSVGSSRLRVATVGSLDAGPAIHLTASGNGYFLTTFGGVRDIYRIDGGSISQIATEGAGGYSANDQIRLRRVSGDVVYSLNGVDELTATDSTHTGGNPGAFCFQQDIVLDDWTDDVVGPVITTQPVSVVAKPSAAVAFTVAATGTGTITYQWQENSTGSWVNIGGATSSTLNRTAPGSGGSAYAVRCVVTDDVGSSNSDPASLIVPTQNRYAAWSGSGPPQ